MTIANRVQVELDRVEEERERLTNENETDTKELDELKRKYNTAIFTGNESEIDEINAQIKLVTTRTSRRNVKLKNFNEKTNPIIQGIYLNELQERQNLLQDTEQKARDKMSELDGVYKELIKGLSEVDDLYRVAKKHRARINIYNQQASEHTREKAGLTKFGVDHIGSLNRRMREFLINDNDLFNRD